MFNLFGGSKRPNTQIPFTLFKPHAQPMPPCPLKPDAWEKALEKYSDKTYTKSLVGMLRYGALIGYTGLRVGRRLYSNHGSARQQPELLVSDLREQLGNKRLAVYKVDQLPSFFVSSPIGLVDKNDGSKRRIHDLSFPEDTGVNSEIHGERTKVVFATLQDIMDIMKEVGTGCFFIKRDFKDAYRHIPISPTDSKLLGFGWEDEYFEERFLPFGLSSAPFLFNFVAEGFHWIIEQRLKPLKGRVVHYLDDFLIVLPKGSKWRAAVRIFDETAEELGLMIKASKSREGEITDFVGFELDSKRMVARLAPEKLEKTRMLVTKWVDKETISVKELEHLLGKLDRASKVVPVGKTHCRRLIALQDQCSSTAGIRDNTAIRISDEARQELEWWKNVLPTSPHIKVLPSNRKTMEVFTSGCGFKGMGGYYLKDKQGLASLPVEQHFMKPHAERSVRGGDPFPREMLAVEEALTMWSSVFKGFRVAFNTSNQGVAFGLLNHTIHGSGPPLDTLKRILLLAQKHDVDISSRWIPNDDNELAISLSRFDRPRIHAIAPKLSGLGESRAMRSDSRFSPSESKFSPSESKFSPSESKFSSSESKFSPSESKFSPSGSKFSPPESKFSPSESRSSPYESKFSPPESKFSPPGSKFSPPEGKFSPSESRSSPYESKSSPPESRSSPYERRFSPSESEFPASKSRFAHSEDRPTPPEGPKKLAKKAFGPRQRQTPAFRNSFHAPPKANPPLSPPPSPPPPPYKRTPSPPPKEYQPPPTKPRAQRRKPRKAVLTSESEAGESSGALEQKKDDSLRLHILLLRFLLFLFRLICMLYWFLWKLVRLISGL